MDAVAQHRHGAKDAVVLEALHRAAAVVLQAVVDVVHALGDVDVVAGHAVVGFDHALEGLVGDGEERVAAEHGLYHLAVFSLGPLYELRVLLDGVQALGLAVAVRDFIAEAGADAELARHVRDGREAAADGAVARVVVEDGRDAHLEAVHHRAVGARLGGLNVEVPVDVPPGALEHLQEVRRGVALYREAAGEAGVDVRVRVYEARHDDAAVRVQILRVRILRAQRGLVTRRDYRAAVAYHRAALKIGVLRVPRDEPSVSYDKHVNTSISKIFFSTYRL